MVRAKYQFQVASIRAAERLKAENPLSAVKSRPWSFMESSDKLLAPSCKLKSRGKSVKCRHSDKALGRNLDASASLP
ncbi:hypothetical protein Y697_07780 [Mesotoga sp. BH458_6_3_2_1]|nr:hypothetical protein Y697_07780 [Mesotoga sp. BH458_6_3_2_1]